MSDLDMINFVVNKISTKWSDLDIDYINNKVKKISNLILEWGLIPGYIAIDSEFSINLVNNKYIRILNKQYCNNDKITNILSFPFLEEIDNCYCLGDIFLAYEIIIQESSKQCKTFHNHVIHLCCHGILHLIGYDHLLDKDALIMENIEINILHELGINSPY